MVPVDKNVMIPNHKMKAACDYYLEQNPWAYQFYPKEDKYFKNLKVWKQSDE